MQKTQEFNEVIGFLRCLYYHQTASSSAVGSINLGEVRMGQYCHLMFVLVCPTGRLPDKRTLHTKKRVSEWTKVCLQALVQYSILGTEAEPDCSSRSTNTYTGEKPGEWNLKYSIFLF